MRIELMESIPSTCNRCDAGVDDRSVRKCIPQSGMRFVGIAQSGERTRRNELISLETIGRLN